MLLRRAGLDRQRLPFEDDLFDAALSTWTRRTPDLLRNAGFVITELDEFYDDNVPKVAGAHSLGVAASA